MKYKTEEKGDIFEINDPWLTVADWNLIESDNPVDFLGLSSFKSIDLNNATSFIESYLFLVDQIKNNGILSVLDNIIK